MNNHALISIDRTALGEINTLEAVNEHINSTLHRYAIPVRITWEVGLGFSKMVNEAMDLIDFSKDKKERSALFKKIQAVFINEGLNDLIEAVMRKFGYQPRFGGSTKAGVVNMKFVPQYKTEGAKADPVAKVANQLIVEKVQADRIKFAEDRSVRLERILTDKYGITDIEAEVMSVGPTE